MLKKERHGVLRIYLNHVYVIDKNLNFRKQAEIDRKKAEVRARLEAQAAGKKAKKGFMTPERKKKLRVSLKMYDLMLQRY